jgi:hypothetical protein
MGKYWSKGHRMTAINDLGNFLDYEGRELQARTTRISSTSIKVTWNVPRSPLAYAGAIVVASPVELNPSNFPTDGVRYVASSNFAVAANKLGLAHVVGAFYDDLLTAELVITGLDPDAPYFVAVHLVSTVLTYNLQGTRAYPEDVALNQAFAGEIPTHYGPPDNPEIGDPYYDPEQRMMYLWDGVTWQFSRSHTTITGDVDPDPTTGVAMKGLPTGYPSIGNFFYNIRFRRLKTWNGLAWREIESKKGQPIYNRDHVGTNGDPAARNNIKMILKHQMGYPAVCVELNEAQFDIAIDNALQELRRRADSAYYRAYFFMQILPGQDVYYLNDPTTGVDKIVDVIKLHRLDMLGLQNFGPNNIYAQQFLNQFYAPGNGVGFDLVSIHLVSSLAHTYTQIFAGDIAHGWRETTRELRLYRQLNHYEKVLIEASCERPEQELLVDRWTQQWIQQWAGAELMIMLGRIRGKFSTLPGPGGGLSLNADSLISEGNTMMQDCLRQMKDFEVGQNGPDNGFMPFLIG